MNRSEFRNTFRSTGPVVFPVIHVLDNTQAERNVRTALNSNMPGVFLINHDFGVDRFLPIIYHVRNNFPDLWLGVNFLGVTGAKAFPILADIGHQGAVVDAYWADDARIDETADEQTEAEQILAVKNEAGWDGMYFGGTAFKKQREVDPDHYPAAARLASGYMDVVTTSGVATGKAASLDKISDFRKGCGEHAIALASGITPENAALYAAHCDAFLVATGINHDHDFYNIDPNRLQQLIQICGASNEPG